MSKLKTLDIYLARENTSLREKAVHLKQTENKYNWRKSKFHGVLYRRFTRNICNIILNFS